ncbi:hypothetical protein LTR53_003175 [Teratosphaeriaceae sp. CCFEE 6253]|nr:hypothetical protein LTR53_003175 [Teratosphaeriaceae sp. CCFEE 6253]
MTLTKIDHPFQNPPLAYDAPPNHQPGIKISFFFNKLPHVSDEHFFRHWETVHADLTIAVPQFRACKIRRYVQLQQTAEMKARARELGMVHVDFDACTELWVERWEDWMAFFNSSAYANVTQPDCPRFLALPIHVMVSTENLIFGPAIPGLGGKDGVTDETLVSTD